MMKLPKHMVTCILATLATASAQDALLETPARGWCVDNFLAQIDNDLFANSDRDYTSGVRFAWGGPLFPKQDYDPIREQLNKLAEGSDFQLQKF
ncbi:MAG TPA: lipid A-modifier LpxR family protein, partial [Luteolibacter sp.]